MGQSPFDSITALGGDLKPILTKVANPRVNKIVAAASATTRGLGRRRRSPFEARKLAIGHAASGRIRWLAPQG